MMILMIRMSSNADEDLDEVNDEVEHPLPDADHQDSGAAVQCIPVIVISIVIIVQGVFFTGTPPKSSSTKKVNLG